MKKFVMTIVKRIFYFLIPSILIFFAFKYYGEETTAVTGKIQSNACEAALGDSFKKKFRNSELAEEAGRKYCECVSKGMSGKQIDVMSELSFKDLTNPQEALAKIQEIANKEGVINIAQDCMQDLSSEYEMTEDAADEASRYLEEDE